jgi:hypothetical protein
MDLSTILHAIDIEIAKLEQAKALLQNAAGVPKKRGRPKKSAVSSIPATKKRRTLSPEAKARIAEAQRKRWAAQKKAAPAKKTAKSS